MGFARCVHQNIQLPIANFVVYAILAKEKSNARGVFFVKDADNLIREDLRNIAIIAHLYHGKTTHV
ncbi:MAG: hypothetical protein RRY38_00955, partial [Oscillospiraceae bacterium]